MPARRRLPITNWEIVQQPGIELTTVESQVRRPNYNVVQATEEEEEKVNNVNSEKYWKEELTYIKYQIASFIYSLSLTEGIIPIG